MKALVLTQFNEGEEQEVTHVIMVPNSSPSLEEIQKEYYKFHHKKLEQVANRLEQIRKGAPRISVPVRTKDGHYSQHFLNRFDEEKRQKKFDFPSWIVKTYKGKMVNFESISQ